MKCIVKDCENHKDQGAFVGVLCMPCHTFLTTGEGKYSQLYRNTVAAEREACAKVCLMPVDEIQVTDDCSEYVYKDHLDCAEAIRARTLHDMNKEAEKNGEEL